jgi:hypothetical protein
MFFFLKSNQKQKKLLEKDNSIRVYYNYKCNKFEIKKKEAKKKNLISKKVILFIIFIQLK